MTSIHLHNISVIRQGTALLDGISLELPPGGNLLITGLSGSGKTLLLQALAGKVFIQGNIEFK
ncbi:ATP-binding cassette domain-containing protein, partial [Micromonospora sp. 4G57]|uniref:ATP-binding cassette domain-containing protein n=1 Tax=Micromonospora sicca TaxID=2202420 RepID=UPI002ACA72A9